MYSPSEGIYNDGVEDGMAIGLEKGRREGIDRAIGIYMRTGHSFDEAFDLFSEPDMDREETRKRLLRAHVIFRLIILVILHAYVRSETTPYGPNYKYNLWLREFCAMQTVVWPACWQVSEVSWLTRKLPGANG